MVLPPRPMPIPLPFPIHGRPHCNETFDLFLEIIENSYLTGELNQKNQNSVCGSVIHTEVLALAFALVSGNVS